MFAHVRVRAASSVPLGYDGLVEAEVLGDRYRLIRRIGKGGFSTVWEAEHIELGHIVAIKILDASRQSEESIARFLREAQALTRLRHPCAVKVFDRGHTAAGDLWIAMELLAGGTLEDRLRAGVLAPAELVALLEPICELLTEAHEQGIVHRDLKPENIMLVPAPGGGWSPRLFDFGIATLRGDDALTHPDLISGTPRYMAPEQWQGLRFADACSDVYSLGVIAYQCLSGVLPVEANGALAWINKHRYEAPRELTAAMAVHRLPAGMSAAVMKALAKDPDHRQQTALELWRELSSALDNPVRDDGEREVDEGAPGRQRSRRRVLRWTVPAVAVAVAVTAVASVAWYRARSDAGAPGCSPLPGRYMPLSVGNSWTYRVVDAKTLRRKTDKKITLDQVGLVGPLKPGVTGLRLYRTDDTGWGYRWWTRTGDKVVWQHDQWFNGDTMVSDRYYVPWRVRVDEACAHRTLGARWTEDYAKVDLSLTDPGDKKVVPVREEWTVEAVDDEVTVPAGTFRAIKLRSRRMDGDADAPLVSIYWFAPGVGKVKEDSDELEDLLEYHVEPEP